MMINITFIYLFIHSFIYIFIAFFLSFFISFFLYLFIYYIYISYHYIKIYRFAFSFKEQISCHKINIRRCQQGHGA